MFPVFSKCMSYHKFKCSECRHLDWQQPPTLQINLDCQSPLRVVHRVGVFPQFNINNALKLKLLDDFTSALDVSCLIMSNKQLVRFVAWIEMWVNRRGCVCPPRHFNKARFVGPGSLKSGTVRSELIEIEQLHITKLYWAGLGWDTGSTTVVAAQNKKWIKAHQNNFTFTFFINWNLSALAISDCHQVLICLK